MALKTESKEINGSKYEVTTFPFRRGLKLKTKILKLIGVPLSSAIVDLKIDGKKKSVLDQKIDGDAIGKAVKILLDSISENEVLQLVEEILSSTQKDGKELLKIMDNELAGEYDTVYKVIGFVLEVNYGSFLRMTGIGNIFN